MRPLYQRLQHRDFNGDGRTTVRPLYQRLQHRDFNGDGRTTVRPYKGLHVNEGYTSRFDTTDAPCVLLVQVEGDAETDDGRIDWVMRCGEALRG